MLTLSDLVGSWRLVGIEVEDPSPDHRVDTVFALVNGELKGAVVSRDGTRTPLYRISFKASELRMQMTAEQAVASGAELVLRQVPGYDRFEGAWHSRDGVRPQGPALKLIRAEVHDPSVD